MRLLRTIVLAAEYLRWRHGETALTAAAALLGALLLAAAMFLTGCATKPEPETWPKSFRSVTISSAGVTERLRYEDRTASMYYFIKSVNRITEEGRWQIVDQPRMSGIPDQSGIATYTATLERKQ